MNKLTKFLNSAYDRWSKYKRPILIVFALSMSYIFYRDHNLVEQLRKYIVAPYLSNFNPSTLFNVLIFIATILLLILKLYRSLKNKPIPSLEINVSLATILIILSIEQFKLTNQFKFVEIITGLTYFEFVLVTILSIILISLIPYIYSRFSKNETRGKSSFTKDFTGDSKECPEDKLGREKFAEEIGKQILNLEPEKGSFCIGIEASWGSGKSFMLNLIERQITDKAITINFNPWKGNETKNIYRDFFYTLSETLGKFDKSINTSLIRYYTVLSDDNSGSIWYYLKSLIFNTQSLRGISEKINERLKCLKKPVIIFIDDIDRLQAEEIFDLLKLIRNISNFDNTIFVVAFDQEYLQNVLTVQNKSNLNFIDKIFQVVFHLPQPDSTKFRDELIKYINRNTKNEQPDSEVEELNELQLKWVINDHKKLIFNILNTPRDLLRFSNQLNLHFKFFKDNDLIYEDFFLVELIRYRFPLVFNRLIAQPEYFFDRNRNKYNLKQEFIGQYSNFYSPEKKQEQGGLSEIAPSPQNRVYLLQLLNYLFSEENNHRYSNSKTINIITNYYRYFSLTVFQDDILPFELKEAIFSDQYESQVKEVYNQKSFNRIIHLFEQFILDSLSDDKNKIEKITRLVAAFRVLINCFSNPSFEIISLFYDYLKTIVKLNSSKLLLTNSELEGIFTESIKKNHNAQLDLDYISTYLKGTSTIDGYTEIGISVESLIDISQRLFNEIVSFDTCEVHQAYKAWLKTKYYGTNGERPQPSTDKLRDLLLGRFNPEFIKSYNEALNVSLSDPYLLGRIKEIFPTDITFYETSVFVENLSIMLLILNDFYRGVDIGIFLKETIISEMEKKQMTKNQQIDIFSKVIVRLNIPDKLKDEVRETFRNSIN